MIRDSAYVESSLLSYAPRGLSRDEAARYIGVGTTKFDEMVSDGRMPRPKRIDGRVVWDRLKIDAAFSDLPDDRAANSWDRVLAAAEDTPPKNQLRRTFMHDYPHAGSYLDRHGKRRWRFRKSGKTIQLPHEPGHPAFEAAYAAALAGRPIEKAKVEKLPTAAVARSMRAAWRILITDIYGGPVRLMRAVCSRLVRR